MSQSNQTRTPADRSQVFEWRVVAPLCLAVFSVMVHAGALGPLAVEIADDLGTTVPMVGQVNTVALAMLALAGLVAGPVSDHLGHRRSILIGVGILAVSALAYSLAPSIWVLLFAGFVAGIGASMMVGVAFAVASARYSGDARRQAISRIQATQSLGIILGAPLLTTIAALAMWRGSYLAVLGVYLVTMALIARWLPSSPARDQQRVSLGSIADAYRPLLRDAGVLRLYAASVLRALGWVGPVLYMGAFFSAEFGLSVRQIGLTYMLASVALFLGNMAAGGRLGNYDLRYVYLITTSVLGLGWVAIYSLPVSLTVMLLILAISAFCAGVSWISLTTMVAAGSPAGPGTTMVLNISIFGIGSALSAGIGGALIGLGGYEMLGVAFPIFAIVGAVLPLWTLVGARASALEETAS